jgi:hypothetical protein
VATKSGQRLLVKIERLKAAGQLGSASAQSARARSKRLTTKLERRQDPLLYLRTAAGYCEPGESQVRVLQLPETAYQRALGDS